MNRIRANARTGRPSGVLHGVILNQHRHTFASWLVMEGVPLFEVSKLLRHASIQMTERYAHLAPDHLHDAVASIKFSAHFQHTTNSEQKEASENGLKAVENGGRGWI